MSGISRMVAAAIVITIMVEIIQKENQELYRCGECGFKYVEKEWAEKCEAWCREHHSCNIEIIAQAVPETNNISGNQTSEKPTDAEYSKLITKFFYGLIGLAASLAFFLALYGSLRLNSSIDSLILNTYDQPFYFWPYVILTLAAIILFGVNASLLAYRWRKFGHPRIKGQAGSGLGSAVGVAASACPVCGSTILTAIGIAGGLTAFPFGGLELKVLSLALLVLPIGLIRKDLRKLESDCAQGVCPMPQDHSFKEKDRPGLFSLLVLTAILVYLAWIMLKTDPAIARLLTAYSR